MNTDDARAYIPQLRALADYLDVTFPAPVEAPPPPPAPTVYETPEGFDLAYAAAVTGDVLLLAPTFVYPKPFVLDKRIELCSVSVPEGRITRDAEAPRFAAGMALKAGTICGLEVRHTDPLVDITTISGANVTVDRCRILGDPRNGAKRGIAANGGGNVAIVQSYIDDCFQSYPGNDSQAICAWDMLPGLRIVDCYLSGGSETIMIGGADPQDEAHTPRNVYIGYNTITKNSAWQALPIGVKNTIEIKNCINFTIEGNDISQSWGGHGQDGYLLALTVRNQDGRAPWSTIQDGQILNNRLSTGAAAFTILGRDTIKEYKDGRDVPIGTIRRSVPMQRVTFAQNTITDLDPGLRTGSVKMVLIDGSPIDLGITDNAFAGRVTTGGLTSAVYFAGGVCERLTLTGNRWPKTKYGIFGSGSYTGSAWDHFTVNSVLSGNTLVS